jgi:hypothetical protein
LAHHAGCSSAPFFLTFWAFISRWISTTSHPHPHPRPRRHVLGRAAHRVRLADAELGQAHVAELAVAARVQDDVLGLEVPIPAPKQPFFPLVLNKLPRAPRALT